MKSNSAKWDGKDDES